jgi:gamma-glutamylcyclotransferase (GGCT)/AIG2-like uncharacterized protein YtfP
MANNLWHNVFVYGTLQTRAQTIRSLYESPDTEFYDYCETTDRYLMFNLGHFPAVIPCDQSLGHPVVGELWRVTDVVRSELDVIEGYPGFYNREIIDTTAGRAWMYYLPREKISWATHEITENQGVLSWLDLSQQSVPA